MMFFDSVRKGFPNCNINVVSNRNVPDFNEIARQRCEEVAAKLIKLNQEVTHSHFIRHLIVKQNEPFYLIDPDTIWHGRMPVFQVPLAGRYIPDFYDELTKCNTYARLHTSCLYVDPQMIKSRLKSQYNKFDFDPISPSMYFYKGKWFRHDCCSKLFHFIEDSYIFSDEDNNKFSHLFCGTHLSQAAKAYPTLPDMHEKFINGEITSQQLLKLQDGFFYEKPWR